MQDSPDRADIDALAAIEHEAAAALRLGKPRAEVWAIMARAGQPRGRLAPAAGRTVAEMRAALTPAQRAWLDAQRPTLPAAGARQ